LSDVNGLSGRLEDEPLPSILHQLHTHQATGVLKLETRIGKHEVYLRDGFPVAVQLPGSAEPIGKVLLEMGLIDEQTYRKSLAEPPPPGVRFGEWLVQKQVVSVEHMKLALKAQVRRKLHRLFFLNEGRFSFAAGEHDRGMERSEPLKIHPARAIYQGVRSAWGADRLAAALFLLDGKALRCTLDEQGVARYGLGPEDARGAALLRQGFWTLPDLVAASGLPAQAIHALVYALWVTEALEVKAVSEVKLLRPSSAAPPPGPPPGPLSTPTPAPPLPLRIGTPPRGVIPPAAGPSLTPPPPSAPLATGAPARPDTTGPVLTADGVRKAIEAKLKTLESENLFQVLGLEQTATPEQIKTAYFDAARRFHPDRLPALGLDSLRPDVEKIFRRVSEAYATLGDEARRAEYVRALAKPAASSSDQAKAMRVLEAEMAFRRGEVHLRRNDLQSALREFEAAVAGNPEEGEHLAYLVWTKIALKQMTFQEARPKMQEATRLSPKCARAYYWLGLCYKEDKELDRAIAVFKRAAELDARLTEATSELRLIQMRREKERQSGGFLDRFRKK
jgi:tetratricopeptide (TPR) repeat protein